MTETNHPSPQGGDLGPIAGEAIKDPVHWPGYVLIAVSVAALALGLAGLAVGVSPAAIGCLAVFAVASVAGVVWQYAEHRRVARRASGSPERPEDTAAL
jgi:hypothetical protein